MSDRKKQKNDTKRNQTLRKSVQWGKLIKLWYTAF